MKCDEKIVKRTESERGRERERESRNKARRQKRTHRENERNKQKKREELPWIDRILDDLCFGAQMTCKRATHDTVWVRVA